MALEELNAFLGLPAFMWAIVAFAMVIVMACLVMVHETFIMTSFAKSARKPALYPDGTKYQRR